MTLPETSRSVLRARPGDRLVIHGHRVGEPGRDAEILDALGEDGAPPFLVRWDEDGHVSRFYPGSDASVQHFRESSRRGRRPSAGSTATPT